MSKKPGQTENPWTAGKINEVRNQVFGRATTDASFRRLCLEDAAAAVREVSGLELPEESPRMRFVERLEEVTIVLPPLVGAGSELAEKELAQVVGGLEQQQKAQECQKMWGLVGAVIVSSTTLKVAKVVCGSS